MRGLLLLLLLLFVGGLAAQSRLLPTQYIVDSFGPKEGLPEERIYDIAQTPNGYLWLGTADGLIRYDGGSFHVQKFGRPEVLYSNLIHSVGMDAVGDLVMSSADGTMHRLHSAFPVTLKKLKPDWPQHGRRWISDGSGALCLTDGDGLLRLQGQQLIAEREPPGFHGLIWSLARAPNRNLWFGTTDGRLALMNPSGELLLSYPLPGVPPKSRVHTLLQDHRGFLWVGFNDGVGILEKGVFRVCLRRKVSDMALDRDGAVWTGTEQGMYRLTKSAVEYFGPETGLPAQPVETVFQDREANLWVSFSSTGLYRVKKPKFPAWSEVEGLSGRALAVRATASGVWFATEKGVDHLVENRLIHVQFPEGDSRQRYLAEDADGRIWTCSDKKVYRIDPVTHRAQAVALPPGASSPLSLYASRKSGLFVVERGGLFHLMGSRLEPFPVAGLPSILTSRSHLIETADGTMWLSSIRHGLFRIERGRATPFQPNDPRLRTIHALYPGTSGDLWIGFDGAGLGRLRRGKISYYSTANGAPEDRIYHIAEDLSGNFWIGMRSRLARINSGELNEYLDGGRKSIAVQTYDIRDGLRSANFGLAFAAAAPGPRRVVWMPSLRDVIAIDPENIPTNLLPPPVNIRTVHLDDKEVVFPGASEITVPPDVERVGITFDIPSLTAPAKIQSSRFLEGYDRAPQAAGSSRDAIYTHLPPGRYTFRVGASNSDGVWNNTGASLTIIQLPAFYQTWWFTFASGFAAIVLVAMVIMWRTRILVRQNVLLEEHVKARTSELEKAKSQAEEGALAKADFLATMSHEIRTPMHGVLGTLELLSGTPLDADQRDYVDTIRDSSSSLLTLLNDILDLSKMEAGRMTIRVAPFSLRQTVENVAKPLETAARLKGISLQVAYDSQLPETFQGDGSRIRQILFNLIGNAVKFTNVGGVRIQISGTEMGERYALTIRIKDTGIGFPRDRIDSLFQKFYQVDGSYSRKHGGSGLGLAICQRLAGLMGGRIEAQSDGEGKGSCFSFHVALPAATRESVTALAVSVAGTTIDRQFQGRVLLAEDNPINRRLAQRLLERMGLQVDLAVNGVEAVERMGAAPYDLVLMDCQMPEMDGLEATRQIRRLLPQDRQPHIVAMTANAMAGDAERCREAGMDGYLSKPFQTQDLIAMLEQHVAAAHAPASEETAHSGTLP